MRIEYRLAEKNISDSRHFCSLYNFVYTKEINNTYYSWQFFSTPFPSYLFLAVLDGIVVGSIGVQVKLLSPHNRNVLSVIDMMVSPQFRGRGIFSGLMKTAMQYGARYSPVCAIVMANKAGKDAICGSLGWSCVTELETMLLTLGELNLEDSLPETNGIQQSYRELSEIYQSNLFHISHSAEYYNWRFQLNSLHKYIPVRKGVSAYSILKVFENSVTSEKYGDFVEIVGKEKSSIKEVAYFSLREFSRMGVTNIMSWLQTNSLWDEIGREMGFRGIGQLRYFCANAFGNSESKLLDSKSWFLQPSDTEIY